MKCLRGLLAIGALVAWAGGAAAELYVVQVGDGAASLTNASTAASVLQFADSGGSPLSTINMPIAANGANMPLTMSGTATSEGFISLSSDGNYLMLGGYGVAPGTEQVPRTDSTVVNRVIGRVTVGSNVIDTTTALTDAYSNTGTTNSPLRSVASTNGVDIWTAGTGSAPSTAGVRYTTLGSTTSTQLSSSPTNTRVVDIVNGQLYVSSASGAFQGVSTVGTGTPMASGETTTLLNGFPTMSGSGSPNHSNYDFWFKDADTVYVASDGTAANGGGIQKWTQSAGTWSLQYILLNDAPAGSFVGSTTTSARGLTGTVDGNNDAVLFATTTQTSANNLITVTDTGQSATATTLASAPTNTVFRGVQFVGSVAPPTNNADFNSDGVVDGDDFLIWQAGFGLTGQTGKTNGNANSDTVVDGLDFDQWKAKFGGPPAVAAAGGVPEPGTGALAVLAACCLFRATGRRE